MDMTMKNHIRKRLVRYWSPVAEKLVFTVVLCTLFYIYIVAAESMDGEISIYFFYQGMMGLMIMLIGQLNYVNFHIPMTMSFGAGRKESLWGMQWANFLLYAQLLIFAAVMIFLMRDQSVAVPEMERSFLGGYAALLLVVMALGQIGVMVALRFGNKGKTIFIIVTILLIIGVVVAVMLFMISAYDTIQAQAVMPDFWRKIYMIEALAAVAGIALYAVVLLKMKKTLMNYEVGR